MSLFNEWDAETKKGREVGKRIEAALSPILKGLFYQGHARSEIATLVSACVDTIIVEETLRRTHKRLERRFVSENDKRKVESRTPADLTSKGA